MNLATLLLLGLLLAVTSAGQSPSKVLKQAEKALGGAKALKSLRSVEKSGTITRLSDGATGQYLHIAAEPNLMRTSFSLDGFEFEAAYNGRSGWIRDSRDGLQTLTGDASRDIQAEALYRVNGWLRYKDEKSKISAAPQNTIDGRLANVVLLTTRKGSVLKLYFDAQTGLPLRDDVQRGRDTIVSKYSDYREVRGVKLPFVTHLQIDDEAYEIRLDQVAANPSIAGSRFDFPTSNAALPDIPTLLKEIQANQDRIEELLDRYSFTQKTISRELVKDGTLRETESETHQLSFYKGYRTRRLIEKNGRPLSEKQQADEDKDVAKQVDEIEKRLAKEEERALKQSSVGTPSEDSRRVSIAEVLRASTLKNPRRERLQGRDVIVFDFEPNPSFDMKNAKSMLKFFGKTAGVIWVDEKDKQIARIEAVLAESLKFGGGILAKLKKGASFTLEQERVNDEIWLPSRTDINLSARVLLFKGIDINRVIRSYDYRRFETEVKGASVDGAKTP